MKYIVKLFPEITIKSRPVRKRFTQRLQSNLKIILQRIDQRIKVRALWDRIDVDCPALDGDQQAQIDLMLANTPGIGHSLLVQACEFNTLDDILERMITLYGDVLANKTFVVRAKRTGEHSFTSHDMEKWLGGGLLAHTEALGVSLREPEITVNLEVKRNQVFLVEKKIAGIGGYPQGTQEPVVSLISGGFDSIVASYLTMKRGAKTHFVFFNLGGIAHEVGVQQAAYTLWSQYGSAAKVKLVSVPFEGIVADILQHVHHSHRGVVLKRMMVRAAERVARKIKAEAIITGESIAQVSSQTLPNLAVIDRATEALVLRPLITFDKQEIIDLASQIGMYDMAANMPEYCGVISDRPTVRAKLSRVIEEEANLDDDVLEAALRCATVNSITDFANVDAAQIVHPSMALSADDVVVDIRHPDEQTKAPLNLPKVTVMSIPFFALNGRFESLANDKHYLLYCDKGIMSQTHAMHLRDQGYANVGVFDNTELATV